MAGEEVRMDDDFLGLNLSLKCRESPSFELVCCAPPSEDSRCPLPLSDASESGNGHRNTKREPFAGGIDVNRPLVADEGEATGMSPKSMVSSVVSGKRSDREDNDETEDDGGDVEPRKKLRLSKEQAAVLEETFKAQSTLNPKQKLGLARELNLSPRQVEVWFQNRRARTKLKRIEADHEYLRRCCDDLAEENRRLHNELKDLRALKRTSELHMKPTLSPPAALAMCPHCERDAKPSPSATHSSSRRPWHRGP